MTSAIDFLPTIKLMPGCIAGEAADGEVGASCRLPLNACEDEASDTNDQAALTSKLKTIFNGRTKQNDQIEGVVISQTTRRTQP
jgi:hypothetical protein